MFSPPFLSLRVKVTVLVAVGTGLVFALAMAYSFIAGRGLMLTSAQEEAMNLSQASGRELNRQLQSLAETTQSIARFVQVTDLKESDLNALIRSTVQEHSGMYGSTVAFQPYAFSPDTYGFAPYYYRKDGRLRFAQLADTHYDYFSKQWYQSAVKKAAPVWTEPYFDAGGGDALMVTYACPFFHEKGANQSPAVRGVVTADLSLQGITKRLSEEKVLQTGFCFLLSSKGTFLATPDERLIMNQTIQGLARAGRDTRLAEVAQALESTSRGFMEVGRALAGESAYLAFVRIPVTDWALGVVFPTAELFSRVNEIHHTMMAIFLTGVCVLIAVSLLVAQSIAHPIRKMVDATSRVAEGDLNIDLPEAHRNDEVGVLANAFRTMAVDLNHYITDLTAATAARERMEAELTMAARIQQSMAPNALPEREGCQAHALMRPARTVGGDLYQWIDLGSDQVCFVIGDVSDKGLPAALFMAVTCYLVRSFAQEGASPEVLLERLNRELAWSNEACMFVTIFCAVLNVQTGELRYASGGHEPAVLLGSSHELPVLLGPTGPAVGAFPDVSFALTQRVLAPGDTLFLYTDGVTDALNANGEAFGEDRLLAGLAGLAGTHVNELTRGIVAMVERFADHDEQADDIAVMAVTFQNGAVSEEHESHG